MTTNQPPLIQPQINQFLDNQRNERQLSANTIGAYARDLSVLESWRKERRYTSWTQFSQADIRDIAATAFRRGQAAGSIQRLLSSIRNFFKYLIREGMLETNPAQDVRAPQKPRRLPRSLDVDEVNHLLNIPGTDPLAKRDRAILELFYSAGLRLTELANLNLHDLDLGEGSVRVTGKGNKQREAPVGRMARQALTEWLGARIELLKGDEPAIFIILADKLGRMAEHLHQQAWPKALSKIHTVQNRLPGPAGRATQACSPTHAKAQFCITHARGLW